MKKIISVLLTAIMLTGMLVPMCSAIDVNASRSQIPIIRISGDGETLYDHEGNEIANTTNLFGSIGGDGDMSNFYEATANVLLPFITDGLLNDNWDPYYEAFYKEISDIFASSHLDKNGDPIEGSGISASRVQQMQTSMKTNRYGSKKYYAIGDYRFFYDWRLDPTAVADDFNEYIKTVKTVTGCEKVGIVATCLGTSVVMAYLAKYGSDDVNGIGFSGSVCNGAEVISESISGKFKVDGDSVTRILEDCNYYGSFDVDEFLLASVDLLSNSGAIDGITASVEKTLYDKLARGVTSALALSTVMTWPGYWSVVSEEDYDDAMLYVFGEEGSEKRTEYAGLIEKIENYNTLVRGKTDDILKEAKEKGVNIGIISKYGKQIIPICQSGDEVADELVTVETSSFGATTSKIYETLSDGYISSLSAENQKYISPDKQIDASTCLFPEYTWFVKGAEHSTWTDKELQILYDIACLDYQITVDDTSLSQFMVYDNEEGTMYRMTEENCDTYVWSDSASDEPATTIFEKLIGFLTSFFNWFKLLIEKIGF